MECSDLVGIVVVWCVFDFYVLFVMYCELVVFGGLVKVKFVCEGEMVEFMWNGCVCDVYVDVIDVLLNVLYFVCVKQVVVVVGYVDMIYVVDKVIGKIVGYVCYDLVIGVW